MHPALHETIAPISYRSGNENTCVGVPGGGATAVVSALGGGVAGRKHELLFWRLVPGT